MVQYSNLSKCLAQSGRMNAMGYAGAVADYYTCSLSAATWSSQVTFISRIDCAAAGQPVNGYISTQWYSQNAGLADTYIGIYDPGSGKQLGLTADLSSQSNGTWIRVKAAGWTAVPAAGYVWALYQNGTQATGAGPGAVGFGYYDVPIPSASYPPGAPPLGYGGWFYVSDSDSLPATVPPLAEWTVTNVFPFLAVD